MQIKESACEAAKLRSMKTKLKESTITMMLLAVAGALHGQGGFVLFGESSAPATDQPVRPLTAPYFHEDAFITSDLRAWHVDHSFSASTIGGSATVTALQVRIALTDSLQLVAYKDGYVDVSGSALGSPSGWNDLAAGLKWAFYRNPEARLQLAAGIGIELAVGDADVLQDAAEYRFWLSANKGIGALNLGATLNYRMADSKSAGALGASDMLTAHLHADYRVNDWFSPVLEINAYFVSDDGAGLVPFSGVDAVSLAGGGNEDTITGAIGAEFRPFGPAIGLRLAYETRLNTGISLFGDRWTFSAVYAF
jgi:hypothetical protein